MRFAGPKEQLRGVIRVAAALGAGAVVAGCSGSGLPSLSGSLPSWFSQTKSPAAQAQASAAPATPAVSVEEDCPSVAIRTGAGTLAVAAKTKEAATANDVRYQLTFMEMARQCFIDGGNMRMRVGVQGRAVVGPAGAPSQVSVPIRYAVVEEGVKPKTIVTTFRRVPLSMEGGNAVFTDIEEDLSFPMPPVGVLQKYVVYVGFDEAGDRGKPQARKKAPKARKRLERSVAPEYR